MFITFKQLMATQEMSKAKIVAGESGLYRLISWYSIVEVLNLGDEMRLEDNLVFIAGIGVKDCEEDLKLAVETLANLGAAGVVFEIGPFIPHIPENVIKIADKRQLPVITLPFEVKIGHVSYAISSLIFNKMDYLKKARSILNDLMSNTMITDEINEKAVYYGFNPKNQYYAIIVDEDDNKIQDNEPLLDKIFLSFEEVFYQLGYENIIWTDVNNKLVFIVPWERGDNLKKEVYHYAEAVRKNQRSKKYKWNLSIGVGTVFAGIENVNQSVEQAKKALSMIRKCKKRNEVRVYEDIGIYRLFFEYDDKSEMVSIFTNTLGKLINYDSDNEMDLKGTLEVFLDTNCNIGLSSEILGIHRNTLKYRIKRIEEILNVDFENPNQCFNLRLAYKIKKYIGI